MAVSIDATPQAREEAEQRRAAQTEGRADMLTERAQRESAQAEARWTAEQNIGAGIPFGQPILAGHHSQKRAERDRDRMQAHTAAAIDHQRKATRAANAAKATATGARHVPVTVANRIERMAADVRRDERELARLESGGRTKTSYAQRLTERLNATRADLTHWQDVRAEQIAQGIATNFGRERVNAGDRVMIRGTWRRVVRANARTVSVETGYSWVDKCPWREVQHHQPAAPDQSSTNA